MTTLNLQTELYDHQRTAYEKLIPLKVGALYMEQGTGKTRTALEILNYRLTKGKIQGVIWLCPFSIKEDLRRELKKHMGTLPDNFIVCGIETLSLSISINDKLRQLTSQKEMALIVDESNLVKNYQALRTKNIIEIARNCTYKMILTGTPLSKNQVDLFSQWYVLDWRILGYRNFWSFSANHIQFDERIPGKIVKCLNVDYLAKKITPYTYQVRKSQCLSLPPKTYSTKYCELTAAQQEHYKETAEELLFKLDSFHPYTVFRLFAALQSILSGHRVNVTTQPMRKEPFFKSSLSNPRIVKLLQIISGIEEEKIIIFCKFTHEITEICEVLNQYCGKGSALRFDGTISTTQRDRNMQEFSKEVRFLVANKKCASRGLNLQYCSYAIYYSNDWEYESRVQSEDRIHRMNQQFNVHIIDICTKYTLDERIMQSLKEKKRLLDLFREELNRVKDRRDMTQWLLQEVVDE